VEAERVEADRPHKATPVVASAGWWAAPVWPGPLGNIRTRRSRSASAPSRLSRSVRVSRVRWPSVGAPSLQT